ncbi:MAG TPA: L,D-transpeptidase family protein [Bacteroidia bacterium]|nr:L,D-transpeptidase family protein [Bacteroidia bacterium]
MLSLLVSGQTFKATQQKAARVKSAYSEKWEDLKSDLKKKGIKESFELFMRVFKEDKIVEVWLKSTGEKEFKLFKTYAICASSGELGPKRKQGDGQVPEGFYSIAVFNPYSSYHLSLGLNYPNASDRIVGTGNLGGDIMIHGSCVTIGCMPLTDTYIKEVYILCVEARNNGQQTIPVHVFPTKMNEKGMTFLTETNPKHLDFWKNLQTGYDYFEQKKQLPKVTVDKKGKYVFPEK